MESSFPLAMKNTVIMGKTGSEYKQRDSIEQYRHRMDGLLGDNRELYAV